MKADMFELLMEAMITGDSSQAILNQEKRGQMQQERSQTLPRECPKKELEQLGFVFGEDADDLFVYVTFPKGWYKKATNHSMWTDLIDDKDRVRGSIFYKAAAYDRSAHMRLSRRYGYGTAPVGGYDQPDYRNKPYEAYVSDAGTHIWHKGEVNSDDYKAQRELEDEARAWLEEHYPDYQNVLAYWNED